MKRNLTHVSDIAKGCYILKDCDGTPDVILIATGFEVSLAVDSVKVFAEQGENVGVIQCHLPMCSMLKVVITKYQYYLRMALPCCY